MGTRNGQGLGEMKARGFGRCVPDSASLWSSACLLRKTYHHSVSGPRRSAGSNANEPPDLALLTLLASLVFASLESSILVSPESLIFRLAFWASSPEPSSDSSPLSCRRLPTRLALVRWLSLRFLGNPWCFYQQHRRVGLSRTKDANRWGHPIAVCLCGVHMLHHFSFIYFIKHNIYTPLSFIILICMTINTK